MPDGVYLRQPERRGGGTTAMEARTRLLASLIDSVIFDG